MELKYKLLDETIKFDGRTLYCIEALKDFNDVKKGDKGGWIESEDNLSHEGNCWIFWDAKVYGNAQVRNNTEVDARVLGHTEIHGCAKVYEKACIYDDANVYGFTKIRGNTHVYIGGNFKVYNNQYVD